jgi:hypothetical protein
MKQIIAVLFSWLLVLTALAEHTSTGYKITKEWTVEPNTAFELNARNQNFKIEIWDKETVRIEFVMDATSGKMDEDDFKDGLKIDAEKSDRKLKVTTNMNERPSSIWSWIFNNNKNNNAYKISNTLYLPKSIASLMFTINYCELIIDDINIPTKINCNYGEVSILKNKNRTTINSSYSDVKIGDISHLKISSSYTDLILKTIDTLTIASSYGDIKLTNCTLLSSLSMNYGDITIGKVGYIKATTTYSGIKINQVMQEVNATLTYSNLKLNNLSKNMAGIGVTGVYSDCEIKINPENPINLIVNDVNGDINIKNSPLVITKKQETSKTTLLHAKTKSATESSPTIKINSKNSDLIFN